MLLDYLKVTHICTKFVGKKRVEVENKTKAARIHQLLKMYKTWMDNQVRIRENFTNVGPFVMNEQTLFRILNG